MGKANQGILGAFTGKVGNVVGQISRGQQVYRVYQPNVNNPKSPKQTEQRRAFAQAVKFMSNVCKGKTPWLDKKYNNGKTAYGEMLGACVELLQNYHLGSEPRRTSFSESQLGDFAILNKLIYSDQGTYANIQSPINGESYINVPDIYTDEQVDEGVTLSLYVLGVNTSGELALAEGMGTAFDVKINEGYIPGAQFSCNVEEDMGALGEGSRLYAKGMFTNDVINIAKNRITNRYSSYVFVVDNLGNWWSSRLFIGTARSVS